MKTVRTIFVLLLSIWLLVSVMIAPRAENSMLLGDTDGDGEVCITDATKIQRDVAQIIKVKDNFRRSADVDSDGIITILDATIIQRWVGTIHRSISDR